MNLNCQTSEGRNNIVEYVRGVRLALARNHGLHGAEAQRYVYDRLHTILEVMAEGMTAANAATYIHADYSDFYKD